MTHVALSPTVCGEQAAVERAKAFERNASRCHLQINEVQQYVSNIFQSVTTNRYAQYVATPCPKCPSAMHVQAWHSQAECDQHLVCMHASDVTACYL